MEDIVLTHRGHCASHGRYSTKRVDGKCPHPIHNWPAVGAVPSGAYPDLADVPGVENILEDKS